MPKASTLLKEVIREEILKLNTAMPCKVVSVTDQTATIQPLFMKKFKGQEPRKRSVVEDVPILKQRYMIDGVEKEMSPVLKEGDIVFVVFAQRALDKVLSGQVAYPEYSRHHSINDAVIVGWMS